MTVINSLQRALNEPKNEEWRKKVLANEFPRSLEEFKKDMDPNEFANDLRDIKSILPPIYCSPIYCFPLSCACETRLNERRLEICEPHIVRYAESITTNVPAAIQGVYTKFETDRLIL